MTCADKTKVECLIRHCRMFLYASNASPEFVMNPVAKEFLVFGLLHLTCTMFITTDAQTDPHGGAFHRVLDKMGHGHLLDDIDAALDVTVGRTTLKQYLRAKRNKLATHGELALASQPKEIQDVTFSKKSLRQFDSAMSKLESAVHILLRRLQQLTMNRA